MGKRLVGVMAIAKAMDAWFEGTTEIVERGVEQTYLDTSQAYLRGKVDGYKEAQSFLKELVAEAKKIEREMNE